MLEEEIERRRDVFIRGNNYSLQLLRGICASLTGLSTREIVPYEIIKFEIVESGWEENRLYVITSRFTASDIHDVRIYLPQERSFDKRYGRCWERAVELVKEQRIFLETKGKEVICELEIFLFEGYPKPPIPRKAITACENFGAVELALQWQRTTGY